MEFIAIDLDKAPEEQIMEAIKNNIRTARLASSEIEKIKRASSSTPTRQEQVVFELEEEPVITLPESADKDEEFEKTVEYYYSGIKNATSEQLQEETTDLIPPIDDYQYERILCRLAAEILRNIKELKDYIATESVSDDELAELEEEMLLEQEKLEIINERLKPKENSSQVETEQTQNNLIFVPTTGGNVRVLDELDRIAPEYYERFYELFQSIKNGTFKNDQRQRRNSELAGLSLVRAFKTRVAYTRLDKNTYAILSAYVKKSDNDKASRNALASKYQDYQAIEEQLKSNLENEEFMALNRQYEAELFSKLAPTAKDKPVAKCKVGVQQ